MSENETHEHGEISTRLFTSAEGQVLKKCMQRRKDPPYLSLRQAMYLSPSHWSGWLIRNKATGRRGKEGGVRRKAFQPKLEQNGLTQMSFDRRDIMLLSTHGVWISTPTSSSYSLQISLVIALLWEQVLYLNSFRQLRGGVTRQSFEICFLKIISLN